MTKGFFTTVLLVLAGAVGMQAGATAVNGVLYDCDMTQTKRGGGYISQKIAVVILPDGTATVSDAVILHVNSVPIAADRVRRTDRKIVVHWTVKGLVNGHNQRTSYFDYQATIKTNGKISVHARPDGYSDRFSGTGTCTTRTE
ncbi:hypothetical protein KX928_08005 [Roseobacter sp. YSTF-M11]|uniref:Uncharacterized protein n=1 Tax=Roseobacter insulae TaxID=2859783 RepID=A0A9X1K1P7_9RHOB|nr:hypothetical protein [Roseobacter insulae]MBW4707728.1 hypothetical protein [Roseobacter insulae]